MTSMMKFLPTHGNPFPWYKNSQSDTTEYYMLLYNGSNYKIHLSWSYRVHSCQAKYKIGEEGYKMKVRNIVQKLVRLFYVDK